MKSLSFSDDKGCDRESSFHVVSFSKELLQKLTTEWIASPPSLKLRRIAMTVNGKHTSLRGASATR